MKISPVVAATLYGESDPCNPTDASAIARVIVNRTAWAHKPWGLDAAGVCVAPWQFSCWNWRTVNLKSRADLAAAARLQNLFKDGDVTGSLRPNLPAWFYECERIAIAAMRRGGSRKGATHYHASYILTPSWARGKDPCFMTAFRKRVSGKLAGHLFYAIAPNGSDLEDEDMWETNITATEQKKNLGVAAAAFAAGAVAGFIGGRL